MINLEKQTVAAIIVTYNRLELLKKCIESVRIQTRKLDKIIIINNSSTDGTGKWLSDENGLLVITQPNCGGAGGFYTGIKTAYEMGYDWIWCMDDDCFPENDALENLLKYNFKNIDVLNSLVLSINDKSKMAFILVDRHSNKSYCFRHEVNDLELINDGCFFNGTLIKRNVIEKIGYPIKELYVRGDEVEYKLRIIKNKFDIETCTGSIIYHPEQIYKEYNFGIFKHNYQYLDKIKRYYYTRNLVFLVLSYKHKRILSMIKMFVFDNFVILLDQNISLFFVNIKAFWCGLFLKRKFQIKIGEQTDITN